MADSGKSQKAGGEKELSMELRLLIAFILMGAVLFLTPYFIKPAAPPKQAGKPAAASTPSPAATPTASPAASPAAGAGAAAGKPGGGAAQEPEQPAAAASASKEETYTVETDLYRVVFSNRGAVVKNWVLKKYRDSQPKPESVDLVSSVGASKTGFPFSVEAKGTQPSKDPNQALFVGKLSDDKLGIEFEFSDGKLYAKKSFRFQKNKYLADFSSELKDGGAAIAHRVTWRGGFGDASVFNAYSTHHTIYYDLNSNKLVENDAKAAKDGPVTFQGPVSFAGIEDTYFAAVALPASTTPFEVQTLNEKLATKHSEGKEQPHVGVELGGEAVNRFQLFVGPKDVQILQSVNPRLEKVVDWGFFFFLTKPLFWVLHYLNDHLLHNYGWAIVVATILINVLLLPLKITNLQSMKKMQQLQPYINAINAKYKDIPMRDPRKNQQNQEIMELYQKHKVNPLGGCVPLVIQFPFLFAIYKVLQVSIELRGAGWLWVTDLSQPETLAIRVLPLAMIASQFYMQKMTPSTGMDPNQQRMMLFMPLMFGFMFYSASSGLVLYWLTGNLVGIIQQWFFNRLGGGPAVQAKPVVKSSRK